MKRLVLITATLALTATLAAGCSKPTALASNANAKGTITVAAAPPKTQMPDLPPEALAELVEKVDNHFLTGVFGSPSLWPVLVSQGHQATAWKALQNETQPSLKHLAKQGATTFWEVWPGPENPKDPAKPYKHSMSHPFQAGFVSWFFSGLGGIAPDPAQPGFRSILLEPQMIDGLDWVKCGFDSPMGEIKSEWKRDVNSLRWEISIPPGAHASVRVPGRLSGITPEQTVSPTDADDAQGKAQRLTLGAGSYVITSILR
mgnify:CR=1 FL=1